METGISTDRLLAYAFATFVVSLAAALCWSKLITGADWVTAATWVTAAVLLGRAATVAAAGYAVTTQAKVAAAIDSAKRGIA